MSGCAPRRSLATATANPPVKENAVSVTDYVIDILLILVIFRQVRPHELTPRAALLPLALLGVAGIIYLRPFTLHGNDLALILILAAVAVQRERPQVDNPRYASG